MDQDFFEKSVHSLVNRQIVFTDIFRNSMYTEFWPGDDSSKDWAQNLPDLKDSVLPIRFIAKANENEVEKLSAKTTKNIDDVCDDFEQSVSEAIKLFEDAIETSDDDFSDPHINAVVSATTIVGSAYRNLVEYKKNLESVVKSKGFDFDTMLRPFNESKTGLRELLEIKFDSALNAARKSIALDTDVAGDIERCMSTRKLFLVSSHFNYMFPQAWDSSSFSDDVLETLNNVLKAMQSGTSFRKSVLTRIDDFIHYDERLHFDRLLAA